MVASPTSAAGANGAAGDWLEIRVDDDGPGLTGEQLAEPIARGRRLDETKPGSGLGHSIVADLAYCYSGKFELDRLRARRPLRPPHPAARLLSIAPAPACTAKARARAALSPESGLGCTVEGACEPRTSRRPALRPGGGSLDGETTVCCGAGRAGGGCLARPCRLREQAGQRHLVGAVAGGLIGNQFGKGGGKVAATVAGAVIGGIVGNEIGRTLDERDRELAREAEYDAWERGPPRRPVRWRNPDNGRYGEIVAEDYYERRGCALPRLRASGLDRRPSAADARHRLPQPRRHLDPGRLSAAPETPNSVRPGHLAGAFSFVMPEFRASEISGARAASLLRRSVHWVSALAQPSAGMTKRSAHHAPQHGRGHARSARCAPRAAE